MNHRQAARDEACVRCGNQDGTTVLAHYQGDMAHKLGKGMGRKTDDLCGAWLCSRCHDLLDGRIPSCHSMQDRSIELAVYCLKTITIRYERGAL